MRGKKRKAEPPALKAVREGTFNMGGFTLGCAILDDGWRVLDLEALGKALGFTGAPDNRETARARRYGLPDLLAAAVLRPFVDQFWSQSEATPVVYRRLEGGIGYGYEVTTLPVFCRIYMDAKEAGYLQGEQLQIADACERLFKAQATSGKVVFVDTAASAQARSASDAIQKRPAKALGQ